MTNLKLFLIGLIMALFGFLYRTDYMKNKDVPCKIIDKMCQGGGRKYHDNYLLICKTTTDNVTFDIEVEPWVYSQWKIGENITLNLRKCDYRQTSKDNILYMFPVIIIGSIGITLMIASAFYNSKK